MSESELLKIYGAHCRTEFDYRPIIETKPLIIAEGPQIAYVTINLAANAINIMTCQIIVYFSVSLSLFLSNSLFLYFSISLKCPSISGVLKAFSTVKNSALVLFYASLGQHFVQVSLVGFQ